MNNYKVAIQWMMECKRIHDSKINFTGSDIRKLLISKGILIDSDDIYAYLQSYIEQGILHFSYSWVSYSLNYNFKIVNGVRVPYQPPTRRHYKKEYRLVKTYRPERFILKDRLKYQNAYPQKDKPFAIYDRRIRKNLLFYADMSEAQEQAKNLNQKLALANLYQWFDGGIYEPNQIIDRWENKIV